LDHEAGRTDLGQGGVVEQPTAGAGHPCVELHAQHHAMVHSMRAWGVEHQPRQLAGHRRQARRGGDDRQRLRAVRDQCASVRRSMQGVGHQGRQKDAGHHRRPMSARVRPRAIPRTVRSQRNKKPRQAGAGRGAVQ